MRASRIFLTAIAAAGIHSTAGASSQKSGLQPGIHVLYLDDMKIETIHVPKSGTVLSFPTKPTKVVLGDSESFAIQYVTRDLVLSPTSASATSHLYVYLDGRRFNFRLVSSNRSSMSVVRVMDALTRTMPSPKLVIRQEVKDDNKKRKQPKQPQKWKREKRNLGTPGHGRP